MDRGALIEAIEEQSRLRGRGGAAFPTGKKWSCCPSPSAITYMASTLRPPSSAIPISASTATRRRNTGRLCPCGKQKPLPIPKDNKDNKDKKKHEAICNCFVFQTVDKPVRQGIGLHGEIVKRGRLLHPGERICGRL